MSTDNEEMTEEEVTEKVMGSDEQTTEDQTDTVEVELKSDEKEEVKEESDNQESSETKSEPEQAESKAESKKDQSSKTKYQRRIDDLVAKQREAERQRDEYFQVAQKVMDENKSLRQRAGDFGKFGSQEFENRVNAQSEAAKIAYRKAYEEGDADKIIEAQQQMIQAESARNNVSSMKRAAENIAQPTEYNLTPPPNNKAMEWANRNSWFNKDMVMTNAAYTIHDELLKSGVQADSDAYYDSLDQRLRTEFPHKFQTQGEETNTPKETTKTVAKTVVTPAGNNVSQKSRKVRLTPSQVAVANRLGVPLEDYAKEFVSLNNS